MRRWRNMACAARGGAACQRAMEREVRRLGSCAQLQERTERVLKAFRARG